MEESVNQMVYRLFLFCVIDIVLSLNQSIMQW